MFKSKWKPAILINLAALIVLFLLARKEEQPQQPHNEVARTELTETVSQKQEVPAQTQVMPEQPPVSLEHPRDMSHKFPPILPRDAATEITLRVRRMIETHPESVIRLQMKGDLDRHKLSIWFNNLSTPFSFRHIYVRGKWSPTMFVNPRLFVQLDDKLAQLGLWHEYQHFLHLERCSALRDAHRKNSIGVALSEDEARLLVEDEMLVTVAEARLAEKLGRVALMPEVYGVLHRRGEPAMRRFIVELICTRSHFKPFKDKVLDWADNPIPLR